MREKWISHAASGVALSSLLAAAAHGATETVTAEVEFVEPVTITETNALRFGLLDVNMAGGDTVTIAPNGGVTESAGNLLNNAQAAASLDVSATPGEAISIFVDNAPGGTGYSLGSFQCDYDGAAVGGCDVGTPLAATVVAGGTATLTIGATLTGLGGASVGDDSSTFDVTVVYQ